MKWYYLVVLWIAVLVIAGYLGYILLPHEEANAAFGYPLRWSNWDGNNYVSIATVGYDKTGLFSYAFFPLYPFIIFLLSKLFIPPFIGAWSINIVGVFALVYLLRELLKIEKWNSANQVLLYIFLFPTAFFFIATYTETLFMVCSVGSILMYRKRKYGRSGLLGMLAAATRVSGLALLVFFFVEILLSKKKNIKSITLQSIPLFFVPLGTALYGMYLYITKEDFLYFLRIEEEEHNRSILFNPFKPLISYIMRNADSIPDIFSTWFGTITYIENVVCWIVLFLLIAGFFIKIKKSYIFYGLTLWTMPLLTGTTSSTLRYVLIIFPVFMILGKITEKYLWIQYCLLLVTTIILIYFTMSFHAGRWVA